MGLVRRLVRPVGRQDLTPRHSTTLPTETVVSADEMGWSKKISLDAGRGTEDGGRENVSSPHEEEPDPCEHGEREKRPLDRRLQNKKPEGSAQACVFVEC